MQPFRIEPKLDVSSVKTYEISAPITSHFRDATCAEVFCQSNARGWVTVIDVGTPLGKKQANYIRLKSGRSFTIREAGQQVEFTFPAGQKCFGVHKAPLERPALFVVRDGDWRGNPRRTPPRVLSAPDWTDDFMEHQDVIATEIEKG